MRMMRMMMVVVLFLVVLVPFAFALSTHVVAFLFFHVDHVQF